VAAGEVLAEGPVLAALVEKIAEQAEELARVKLLSERSQSTLAAALEAEQKATAAARAALHEARAEAMAADARARAERSRAQAAETISAELFRVRAAATQALAQAEAEKARAEDAEQRLAALAPASKPTSMPDAEIRGESPAREPKAHHKLRWARRMGE
jgi:SWI/SNF-related matrix-associated actin-dependent regulator 1 of chromatin subfamily A